MKNKIRKFICKIGIHKYKKVRISKLSTPMEVQMYINLADYCYQEYDWCKYCGKIKNIKYYIHRKYVKSIYSTPPSHYCKECGTYKNENE